MKILDEIKAKAEAVIESRYAFADVERLHIALSAEMVLAMVKVIEAAEEFSHYRFENEALGSSLAEDIKRVQKALKQWRDGKGGEDD